MLFRSPIDALVGYGIDVLLMWLLKQKDQLDFVDDQLRHSMPAGVCSYCVGETRVGAAYQQGVISKIEI